MTTKILINMKIVFVLAFFLVPLMALMAQTEITKSSFDGNFGDSNITEPKLIWSDEFNGTGIPDPSKWVVHPKIPVL